MKRSKTEHVVPDKIETVIFELSSCTTVGSLPVPEGGLQERPLGRDFL